jgi:glycosyltransferase involved in cell wall biosynthesis
MTFIIKKPTPTSKGILILKHSELDYFNESNPVLNKAIQLLKESYVVGVHWCFHKAGVKPTPNVDFHMSDNTVDFDDASKVRIIPLDCKHFTPKTFRKMDVKKEWDIFNMSRPANFKCLDDFLKVVRLIFDKRDNVKVLLICPDVADWSIRSIYTDLLSDYHRLFTQQEKQRFKLVIPKLVDTSLFPFSLETMAYFMNASKVSTLFSKVEGQSRVIHESLLCGLPIVARAKLKGGGLNYLNDTNSKLFTTLEEARDCFLDLIDNPQQCQFDNEALREELGEDQSGPKLINEFKNLFSELKIPFDGEIDITELSFKLPSHTQLLPSKFTTGVHDEIINSKQFYYFIHYLLKRSIKTNSRCLFLIFYTLERISILIKKVISKLIR